MISRNCIVYCLITDCYYKPNDTIINTSNVDIKATTFSFVSSSALCFLFFAKSPIILPLYSSKIAWDIYAPLQMISEYFPASGRSLNWVEKPRGIRTWHRWPYWLVLGVRPHIMSWECPRCVRSLVLSWDFLFMLLQMRQSLSYRNF